MVPGSQEGGVSEKVMRVANMSMARQFRDASPEADLLLSLLRLRSESASPSHTGEILSREICWEKFVSLALRNRVLPTISHSLLSSCRDKIPPDIVAFIEDRFRRNIQRNQVLCRELIYLNKLFLAHDIQIINYKGPETVARIGLNINECQFNDLDFLLREEQEVAARKLLLSHGYCLELAEGESGPRKDYTYVRQFNDDGTPSLIEALPEDVQRAGRIIIEPHLHVTEYRLPITIESEALWERAGHTEFLGASLPVLSDEDSLLILCVAGCKARWKNLKLVNHVAAAVRNLSHVSIERCLENAKAAGCERMVLLGLLLANGLLGVKVERELIERAKRARLEKCAERVILARSRDASPSFDYCPYPWKYSSIIRCTLDRSCDRARYLWRTITRPYPIHRRRFPLPGPLQNLYSIIVPTHDYVLVPACRKLRRWYEGDRDNQSDIHEALQEFRQREEQR